ncbi:uncharacterized protein VDAG_06210 [Verticillium dahliae VdLs.17]|uniref:Gylcosyl hydrolase 115 C-terminal domain-containing protein n=1 Tax=Verticillium dahliae (strain VdLs.17 / ATCC MYA-4575 / FGSC 10137) TaxID=498257 RepID=G2X8R9_VERDV|nr:uncharacterized protein VDAG_06210 [Verticillium dahliae VdLs.17]EGY15356.1 hypothetical protein VDAG_06210 [Verticillium dahliae VdLs.17]
MAVSSVKSWSIAALTSLLPLVSALGQSPIVAFESAEGSFQIAGGDVGGGQIRVSANEYWGVIRAAGDLAADFGRVTGTNYTLSNGESGAQPAAYTFAPVDVTNNTHFSTTAEESLSGPEYSDPDAGSTVIIAGTIGHSEIIDQLIESGLIDVGEVEGEWEAFVSQLVENPIEGVAQALVIAGSDPRGTIYGIYDVSEQIGVSPWYFWADVPTRQRENIYALSERKVQKTPSVKYRGFFLNDEQPGLSSWVSTQWNDTWNDAAPYNRHFYALIGEVLLRLRANYLWPTVWGSMVYIDDPYNQPLLDAFEIVLGGSHTEPMMRAQNEFRTFYEGPWQYTENNETIDEYFRYGVERAKPYARNSVWTMAMRGTGDTAIEGNLGIDGIVSMLETLVDNQRSIIEEGLEIESAAEVDSLWCLYKEVQSYQERGLVVPEDITLLWADDNWGNVRRLPLANETDRSGGAGVYYHFDYVGDPRNYKWINTIQLEKTASQMYLSYARHARKIWIVNVGDLKPKEIPISHFFDIAYDIDRWGADGTTDWVRAWVERDFGGTHTDAITDILTRYGMYAARRKYELVEPQIYSVINYHEAEAVLEQWAALREDTQAVYDELDEAYQPAFFQMLLHPVLGAEIVYKIQINGAKNQLYAGQKRNSANDVIRESVALMYDDSNLNAALERSTSGSSSSSPSNSTGSNSTSVSRRQDSNETAPAYHTLRNYGRTLAGVGLYPLDSEKLEVGEGPALEYSVYLFTNHSAANVTVYMSPGANYLGDNNPLQYAIALFPAGDEQPEPTVVTPIGPNVGSNMPDGWGQAVANAVWGLQGNYTTSSFNVTQEGAYTLRIWALLPNIVVQKIVIDLGGVRDSYLGPPESFLVGRDERGSYNGTSFATTPGIVGGVDHNRTSLPGGGESEEADGSNEASNGAGGLAVGGFTSALMVVLAAALTM